MVTFKLQSQSKDKAVYNYYPENDTSDCGVITVSFKTQRISVTKCHFMDFKRTISVNQDNDTSIYVYASYAINRISDEYNDTHKLPVSGKAMWY